MSEQPFEAPGGLVDPEAAFFAQDPSVLRPPGPLPAVTEDHKTDHHMLLALGLGAAFITAAVLTARALHKDAQDPDTAKRSTDGTLTSVFNPVFIQNATPILIRLYAEAGEHAADMAATHAKHLAVLLGESSAQAVLEGYQAGMNQGLTPEVAWRRAAAGFGLTSRDMRSFLTSAQTEGYQTTLLTPRATNTLQMALTRRADLMGRDETFAATSVARVVGWLADVAAGRIPPTAKKKWVTAEDEKVCPLCGAMNGRVKPLDEPFTLPNGSKVYAPLVHVNCRCVVQLVNPRRVVFNKALTKTGLYDPRTRDEHGEFASVDTRTREEAEPEAPSKAPGKLKGAAKSGLKGTLKTGTGLKGTVKSEPTLRGGTQLRGATQLKGTLRLRESLDLGGAPEGYTRVGVADPTDGTLREADVPNESIGWHDYPVWMPGNDWVSITSSKLVNPENPVITVPYASALAEGDLIDFDEWKGQPATFGATKAVGPLDAQGQSPDTEQQIIARRAVDLVMRERAQNQKFWETERDRAASVASQAFQSLTWAQARDAGEMLEKDGDLGGFREDLLDYAVQNFGDVAGWAEEINAHGVSSSEDAAITPYLIEMAMQSGESSRLDEAYHRLKAANESTVSNVVTMLDDSPTIIFKVNRWKGVESEFADQQSITGQYQVSHVTVLHPNVFPLLSDVDQKVLDDIARTAQYFLVELDPVDPDSPPIQKPDFDYDAYPHEDDPDQ